MQLWTKEHFLQLIPSVAVMIIIALFLNKLIGKKPHKIRMIPFQILAVILLLSEVGKQVISFSRGYDLYHIPLHVCSLFILLIPAMAFYGGKHKDTVRTVACSICVSLMLFMTIYPNLIYSPGNITNFFGDYFDFHTVFFHNVVIFEFILIIVLRLHSITEKKSYLRPMVIFSSSYALIAAVMAQLLKTNFSNFYSCNIPPIEALVNSIKDSIGYTAGQALYVSILFVLHVIFFTGAHYLYRAIDKLNVKLRGKANAEA